MGEAPEYLTEQLLYVGETQPYRLWNVMDFRFTVQWMNSNAILNQTVEDWMRKKMVLFVKKINISNNDDNSNKELSSNMQWKM